MRVVLVKDGLIANGVQVAVTPEFAAQFNGVRVCVGIGGPTAGAISRAWVEGNDVLAELELDDPRVQRLVAGGGAPLEGFYVD